MTNTNQLVPRIPATEWLQEHTDRMAKLAETTRLQRERERETMKADASHIVDVFMLQVAGGENPWKGSYELNLGEGDHTVLTMAKDELISLGYKARVDHPTDVGPGGRGQTTATWTNEKVWNLYVQRPGAR